MKKYEDIIGLSRPVSKKHPPMSRENRAAQFAPFAALTGFEGAIKENNNFLFCVSCSDLYSVYCN